MTRRSISAMHDVFVSYSRNELDFVHRLAVRLRDSGFSVWVDVDGIYPGEVFWPEVAKAIDDATVIVFVLTPQSLESEFCLLELDRAIERHKRIVPLLHRAVATAGLHEELGKRQWVFFRNDDDPDRAFEALLSAVRADWGPLRELARLLQRATEWEAKEGDDSLLLRGRELRHALALLHQERASENGATELHRRYVRASRRAAWRRALRLGGATAAAAAALGIVTWVALAQRVESLNDLGDADLQGGRAIAAIDELERANAICALTRLLVTGCLHAVQNLGNAYSEQHRHEEALAQFSRALKASERHDASDRSTLSVRMEAYQGRAYTRIMRAEQETDDNAKRLAEYDLAEIDAQNAAALRKRLKVDDRTTITTMGRLQLGRGQYAGALKTLESLGKDNDNENVAHLLSLAHHCLGDLSKSTLYFDQSIRLGTGRNPNWFPDTNYDTRVRDRCKRG